MSHTPRWWAQFRAAIGGYFWLPCPICREYFGGHEAGSTALMVSYGSGQMVCYKPACNEEAARRTEAMFDTPEARAYLSAMYSARLPMNAPASADRREDAS